MFFCWCQFNIGLNMIEIISQKKLLTGLVWVCDDAWAWGLWCRVAFVECGYIDN